MNLATMIALETGEMPETVTRILAMAGPAYERLRQQRLEEERAKLELWRATHKPERCRTDERRERFPNSHTRRLRSGATFDLAQIEEI